MNVLRLYINKLVFLTYESLMNILSIENHGEQRSEIADTML